MKRIYLAIGAGAAALVFCVLGATSPRPTADQYLEGVYTNTAAMRTNTTTTAGLGTDAAPLVVKAQQGTNSVRLQSSTGGILGVDTNPIIARVQASTNAVTISGLAATNFPIQSVTATIALDNDTAGLALGDVAFPAVTLSNLCTAGHSITITKAEFSTPDNRTNRLTFHFTGWPYQTYPATNAAANLAQVEKSTNMPVILQTSQGVTRPMDGCWSRDGATNYIWQYNLPWDITLGSGNLTIQGVAQDAWTNGVAGATPAYGYLMISYQKNR